MSRKHRKNFKECLTEPPSSPFRLAVSRIADEQEHGYDSLSLLLLLFESVLDLRLDQEADADLEPWISYRQKMYKPQGRTIECLEIPFDPKMKKPLSAIISISTLPQVESYESMRVSGAG